MTAAAINFQPILIIIDRWGVDLMSETNSLREELMVIKTDLANFAGQIDKIDKEKIIEDYRLGRLDNWARPVGNKVGIPFET